LKQIRGARIAGTGSYVPPNVLSNKDLESLVETSDEWITSRTGIKERHIAAEGVPSSDLAAEASRRALAEAGVDPAEIELVMVSTVTPDRMFPSTACTLQQKLGTVNGAAFDLSAACSGFIYGLSLASGLIGIGAMDKILVVGVETLSKIVDWKDRNTCVLFGDGAGAAVVIPCEPGRGVLSTSMGSDGSLGSLLELPGGGSLYPATENTVNNRMHFIKMKGNEVFKNAVRAMETVAKDALEKANVASSDLSLLITHQANLRIIEATAKRLGVSMDRVFVNLHKYGNTSAASVPMALDEARKEGRVGDNDLIALVAFGAGFTWGAAVLRW